MSPNLTTKLLPWGQKLLPYCLRSVYDKLTKFDDPALTIGYYKDNESHPSGKCR